MKSISTEAICEHLRFLKEQSNMTLQEISDASHIPLSTVKRIFAGQTDSPGFQTVCDLIRVMGGSLDTLLGLTPKVDPMPATDDPMLQQLEVAHAETIRVYRESILSVKATYAHQQKWVFVLFVTCGILMAIIVAVLFFDLTHPGIGFFR